MAISEAYGGGASMGSTEYDLTSSSTTLQERTDDGVYQCFLDLNALATGDTFEFRVYEKVRSISTQRIVYAVRFSNGQNEPVWVSPSLVLIHGWTMTVAKIAGTDRTIGWSIRSIS
jgi:hypothetical protein